MAVLGSFRDMLQCEVEINKKGRADLRECLLGAFVGAEDYPKKLPKATSQKWSDWDGLCESLIGRLFWDYDFAMGDQFLDLPPDEARAKLREFGIDPDYYLDTPDEPGEKGLIAARQTLARLLDLPVPDDDGLYPSLNDLYHELLVGPVPPNQAATWDDHPWLRAVFVIEPTWDCDLVTWRAEFAGAVPTAPFAVTQTHAVGSVLPGGVRVEQADGGWVVRREDGSCWCSLIDNSWADTCDENACFLTFPTEAAAVAAFVQADRMCDERAERQRAALDRLDELDARIPRKR